MHRAEVVSLVGSNALGLVQLILNFTRDGIPCLLWATVPGFDHRQGDLFFFYYPIEISCVPNCAQCLWSYHHAPFNSSTIFSLSFHWVIQKARRSSDHLVF